MTHSYNPDTADRTPAEERDYILKRAEHHRQLADKTPESGSRVIHLRFERLYKQEAARLEMVLQN